MTPRWKRWLRSPRLLILPPVLFGLGVVGLLAASRKELRRVEISEEAMPLEIVQVSRQQVYPRVTGFGTAIADRQWNAVAEVGGRVTRTHPNLKAGAPVQADALLIEIDPTDYQLRLDQREADLKQAEAQLRQLKLNLASDEKLLSIQQELLEVRRNDVGRLETLRSREAASDAERDVARAGLLQQQQSVQTLAGSVSTYPAQIEAAQAAIATARSRVGEAQRDLKRTRVTAPFSGLLRNVRLEPGQYVAPGQSLFELIDTSRVEIETQISTSQWSELIAGSTASAQSTEPPDSDSPQPTSMADAYVRTAADRGLLDTIAATVVARRSSSGEGSQARSFEGQPVRFSSAIDTRTRTLGVVIRVENPTLPSGVVNPAARQLRAGTYCEVSLRGDQPIDAFRLPRHALDGSTVLVLDEDNRLHRKEVDVAFFLDQDAVITAGIKSDDRVVTTPPAMALEGQLVDPIRMSVP